ncbi:MAG: hypothetical protein AAFP22_11330, partial [Planctomycetota bacterium]
AADCGGPARSRSKRTMIDLTRSDENRTAPRALEPRTERDFEPRGVEPSHTRAAAFAQRARA